MRPWRRDRRTQRSGAGAIWSFVAGVMITAVGAVTVVLVRHHLLGGVHLPERLSLLPGMLVDPWIWLAIGTLLSLERLVPARPQQLTDSVGLREDVLWFVLQFGLWTVLLAFVLDGLDALFSGPLSALQLHADRYLPVWALIVIGTLIGELVLYTVHRLHHRVPALWRIHSVHHSQTQLNLFSDVRVHPIEVLLSQTAFFLPIAVLGGDFAHPVGLLGFGYLWLTRLDHTNVRTNLGPLRWVLVTPQSHRIHHSTDPEHHDCNFGSALSVWDRVFGTQHPDDRSYPPTGIEDADFPLERDRRLRSLLSTYVTQLAYPFRRRARLEPSSTT